MNDERLSGKVAQILSETEIVINIGSNEGVRKGDIFAVLAAKPLEVFDPDTNALLGMVEQEKVRVRATIVQERLTICATSGDKDIVVWTPQIAVDLDVLQTFGVPKRPSDAPQPARLSPSDRYVKIGDSVVTVERALPF